MRTRFVAVAGALTIALATWGTWQLTRTPPSERAAVPRPSVADDAAATGAELPHRAAAADPTRLDDGHDATLDPTGASAAGPDAARAEVAEAGADTVRLTVLHASGAPAAGATVVLADGSVVLASDACDASGSVVLPGRAGTLDAWTGGVTLFPVLHRLASGVGEHELVLPAGRELAGTVLVDGRPPEEPLGLRIAAHFPQRPEPPPYPIVQAMQTIATGFRPEIGQLVRADGSFLFSGLPDDWVGSLRFPLRYKLESGEDWRDFEVDRPRTDLVVRLAVRAAVRGRAVDVDGRPVARATLRYEIRQAESGRSGSTALGDDGRFELPLHIDPTSFLKLQLASPDGSATASLDVVDVDPLVGRDLGDVVLAGTRSVPFLVRDVLGEPVEGAVARGSETSPARGGPTDAEGRATLVGAPPDLATMQVTALGYAIVDVPLPSAAARSPSTGEGPTEGAAPAVVVTLPRTTNLDVRVLTPDGRPAGKAFDVELSADHPLFEVSQRGRADPWQIELGASDPHRSEAGTGRGRIVAATDAQGRVLVPGMLPVLPFDVAVRDAYGMDAGPSRTLALQPGEQHVLAWTLDRFPRDVHLRVVDEAGLPLERADIRLGRAYDMRSYGRTDADGRATYTDLIASEADLRVSKNGYAPFFQEQRPLPVDGSTLTITLARAEPLRVDVVDASGRPAEVDEVVLVEPGPQIGADRRADGSWWLPHAPRGVVQIQVDREIGLSRHVHDARTGPARIVLAEPGSLEVDWTVELPPGAFCFVRLGPPWERAAWTATVQDIDGVRPAPARWGALEPGDYEAQLMGREPSGPLRSLSGVVALTIRPGATTRITLEP